MILGHTIALDPTEAQAAHFRRAAGVARFAYNWALAEWQRMHEAGEKPSTAKIKAKWNTIRKVEFPWSYEVTKCASGQAILDLGTAFSNFFRDLKKPKGARKSRYPKFKKKRAESGSFALWNDQFAIDGEAIRIPTLGWVRLREPLRFTGKIMGARVVLVGGRWCVSVQVETAPQIEPAGEATVGIDLGISTLMTLSRPLPDGRTEIENPGARRALLGRQRKLARRISRQEEQRRRACAKTSGRQRRRRAALAKLHHRIASIRKDAIHKATTAVASAFSILVIEDLNVAGMVKNHSLAGAVSDAAFGEIRRQLEYKATLRGGRVVVADRYFPSSRRCSDCGHVVDSLPLHVREWGCPKCGTHHKRDHNAATNLELLVGPAGPKPLADDPLETRGDIAALAVGQPATKPRWLNRELNQCSPSSTS